MNPSRGTVLLLLILLVYFYTIHSRVAFHEEGPPAFFMEKRQGIAVMLGEGFPDSGVYQFSDGITPLGVIEMTDLVLAPKMAGDTALRLPLRPGEALDIFCDGPEVSELKRFWIPASQRMALGIPLHPDRMSLEDWEALPGIGPNLAQRIEDDRQQNGDFGSLEALKRVRGIGPWRIKAWRKIFR